MSRPADAGVDEDLDEYHDTSDAAAENGDDDDAPDVRAERGERLCGEPGCTTVLSRYNATNWCGLHHRRDWRATREIRRRSA